MRNCRLHIGFLAQLQNNNESKESTVFLYEDQLAGLETLEKRRTEWREHGYEKIENEEKNVFINESDERIDQFE